MEMEYMKISSILLSPEGERTIIHYETPHEHIIRTEKDLEEFKDYLICNKSDNNLLIEIERRISYRINKLKLENDYIFI